MHFEVVNPSNVVLLMLFIYVCMYFVLPKSESASSIMIIIISSIRPGKNGAAQGKNIWTVSTMMMPRIPAASARMQ